MQNIIFDLGRVLLDFQPQAFLESLFGHTHLIGELKLAVFDSPEWTMLDRGVISQDQAAERLIHQHPELAEQIRIIFSRWFSILTPIESSVECLYDLKKQGYGLYVLSNFHREAFEHVYAKYEWFQLFDGMIISYAVQALKPEPAIYEALLTAYNLEPAHCLFIDDLSANIEGGRQLGIKGIQYQNHAQLLRDLEQILR